MRFFIKLLLCATIAYALAAIVAIPANPEIQFWHGVDQQRDREIAEVRKNQPGNRIIFFAGGSSCAFSIDPKIIEEKCATSAFNLGLPVSAGPRYLLHQALEKAQSGDMIVITLEPDALTYETDFPTTTFSYAMAGMNGNIANARGGPAFGVYPGLRDYLNFIRPGPSYIATLLAKKANGMGYRYTKEGIRYHGRIETQVSMPLSPAGEKPVNCIADSGRKFLETYKSAAAKKNVSLVYSMPWSLTGENASEKTRQANRGILESISPIIPTIDDGYLGVATDPKYFSDSVLHLSSAGSALRSTALADALSHWLNPGSIKN